MATPAEVLARCEVLDGRIDAVSKAIQAAPTDQISEEFRAHWLERLRRWQEVRRQCGDWNSRFWGVMRWGPELDSWMDTQANWEAKVQNMTGVAVPIGKPLSRPDDETLSTAISQSARFLDVRKSFSSAALIIAGGAAAALVVFAWRRS